ncbi:type I-E CRISPR-associated protein Cas6/Cse3/CasE [Marinivivus vitaminiproducens]|uniref:type I-E CRISPR-associated protein Cas6/Cse3/CasE n=1 Tax=Marinivivus vitaminiproducens TaxID=3035935 RepID=UPI0027A07FE4|nr:type I-E CRISPR-associated protein Cas6/Cse3/CasE [Geminicoccaceae bacterium SCSIO 64248]
MMTHFLSRVRLNRDAPAAAIAPVLLPDDPNARCGVAHRLVWTLFADGPERSRDFLWREEAPAGAHGGHAGFLILSTRPPVDAHGLFHVESKPFEPHLSVGDRLAFSLRVNPVITRTRTIDGRPKHTRSDVVMDLLRPIPRGKRAERRPEAIREGGLAWLARQAASSGFAIGEDSDDSPAVRVDGYEQMRVRRRGAKDITFSALEMDGVLRVDNPERFLQALYQGFGKAKAFGCGLMLIRRARP